MNVIAVISEKGGVGKTTIAIDLAVAAVRKQLAVAVLDIDPQATAANWLDRRTDKQPWVIATPVSRLVPVIAKAKAEGVDIVIIDTQAQLSMDSAEAARRADLVLIPIEPHLFSLETVAKVADLLRYAGNPASAYIINKAPIQGQEATEAAAFITAQGLTLSPVVLHTRAAHRHASNAGQVAAEFDEHSKAAEEAAQLAEYVFRFIKLNGRRKNNGKE
jgi:chromosome partitioning protein